jgi:hypothetical protein
MKHFSSPETEPVEPREYAKSPLRFRIAAAAELAAYCKKFEIQGLDELVEAVQKIREEDPEARFEIVASHFSDMDALAAVKALGETFNIQIAAESLLPDVFKKIPGSDNFTSLDYKKTDEGKAPVFNPRNFDALEEEMEGNGKTPWMAAHSFSRGTQMERARIGPAYLAQKTGAYIIPAALEITSGTNVKLDMPGAVQEQLKNRLEVVYHLGKPVQLPKLDVAAVEKLFGEDGRQGGKDLGAMQLDEARRIHHALKEQSEEIAYAIAAMLPENQRGAHKTV